MSPKSAKKKPHLLLSPRVFSPSFLFDFSQLYEELISLCSLTLSEGMQYTVGPRFIDMNLLTFLCMYYTILLLMTDKYTELIFILLHFIYIHKYIYIKMFTVRFLIFFFFNFFFLSDQVNEELETQR